MTTTQRRSYKQREASGPLGDEVLTLEFTVYFHEQRLTVNPAVGVRPIRSGITIYKTPRGNAWRIQSIDTQELNLYYGGAVRSRWNSNLAPVVLKAMTAIYAKDIDPFKCVGWGRWLAGGHPAWEQVREAFEQWKVKAKG